LDKVLEGNYARDRDALETVSTVALFGLASEQLDRFRDELMSATFQRVGSNLLLATED
jgi:hypothetical protein